MTGDIFGHAARGLILAGMLAGWSAGALAQTDPAAAPALGPHPVHATGATPIAPADYATLPKLPTFRAWLPRRVDLTALFPVPGYQAQVPDCSA